MEAHGKYVAERLLNVRPGTRTYYLVHVIVVFVLSALVHQVGEFAAFGKWSTGSLRFFIVQGIAVALENMVIALAKGMGVGRKPAKGVESTEGRSRNINWKIVGYVWVFIWNGISGPILVEAMAKGGFIGAPPHFSWVLGMLKGDWWPTPLA